MSLSPVHRVLQSSIIASAVTTPLRVWWAKYHPTLVAKAVQARMAGTIDTMSIVYTTPHGQGGTTGGTQLIDVCKVAQCQIQNVRTKEVSW